MKPYKILIFILLAFTILGSVGSVFPEEGLEIGERTLFFPAPSEILKSEGNSNGYSGKSGKVASTSRFGCENKIHD